MLSLIKSSKIFVEIVLFYFFKKLSFPHWACSSSPRQVLLEVHFSRNMLRCFAIAQADAHVQISRSEEFTRCKGNGRDVVKRDLNWISNFLNMIHYFDAAILRPKRLVLRLSQTSLVDTAFSTMASNPCVPLLVFLKTTCHQLLVMSKKYQQHY